MITYDYQVLRKNMLVYLHTHRKEDNAYLRTSTGIRNHFRYSVATFNRIIYELRGEGIVDFYRAGNCKVWYLTDKGIMKIEQEAQK